MSSSPPDSCAMTLLPYELRRMIVTKLSDTPSAIRALAKTCTQFYVVYHDDKQARLQYATELTERLIGVSSATAIRLCILLIKIESGLSEWSQVVATSTCIDYCRRNWVFSASDFQILRSASFRYEIRRHYRDAQQFTVRMSEVRKWLQHGWRGSRTGAPKSRTDIPISSEELEEYMMLVLFGSIPESLKPANLMERDYYHLGLAMFQPRLDERHLLRVDRMGEDSETSVLPDWTVFGFVSAFGSPPPNGIYHTFFPPPSDI
ncbi:hypothetical protein F4824DRAFT_493814 [Ustulina deusta]|nr:hypothetical protein F4824DRAFT_493814 [Ustulina deusta]